MKVVLIGSGNVATVLGKRLLDKGFTILQVFSRNIEKANALSILLNARAVSNLFEINTDADVYIIAVADKAIESIVQVLSLKDKLVLHTAGSVSKEILKHSSTRYGVLYPIQSLRSNMDISTPIPFLIDGNTEEVISAIENIAQQISATVAIGNDEKRLKLHVAAVFVCNFVNYLYLQSANFCKAEAIDFSLLQPLIEETATRIRTLHPSEVFTGPAVRGDMETIEKHLAQLENYPGLKNLYAILTHSILNKETPQD